MVILRTLATKLVTMASIAITSLVLLAVLVPAAAAQSPPFQAPYTAATAQSLGSKHLSGCGSSISATAPGRFNLTTGVAKAQATARVSSCGNSTAVADLSHRVGLKGLNFTVPTSGQYNISCLWNVSLKVTLDAKPMANPNGSIQSGASVALHCWVIDVTTGIGSGVDDTILGMATDKGQMIQVMSNVTFDVGRTTQLVAGDQYIFLSYLSYDLYAHSYPWVPAGASASATLGMMPPIRGAILESVSA
jgi:hypothetical protein